MGFLDPNVMLPFNPSGLHAKKTKLSALVAKYSDWDNRVAVAVALAESRGRVNATHKNTDGSTDYGLFQVNSVHGYDPSCLLQAECNVDKAHEVWLSQGWAAWTTYKTGAYKLFLGHDADVATGVQTNAGAAVDSAKDAVTSAADGIGSVGDFLHWVTDAATWQRIGKGVMGSGILIIGVAGIAFIVANKAASSPTAQAIPKVIPV